MNRLGTTIVAVMALQAGSALAHGYKVGSLSIEHPWVRATPKGAPVGGGYATITNNGSEPDRLIGASFSEAGRTEIHLMSMQDGVMKMRPLKDGIQINPGETVALKPGGYHLMFMDLHDPLVQGNMVDGTLVFQKAGTVQVKFKVESIGALGGGEEHTH